jgi:hypothetical protein
VPLEIVRVQSARPASLAAGYFDAGAAGFSAAGFSGCGVGRSALLPG